MLFVHHGLLWGRAVPLVGFHLERAREFISNDMALYAAHLPLDMHEEVGNNGAIAERDLRSLLDTLTNHDVALVSLYVPRSWERYNNDLFARAAADYPNVRLLDWTSPPFLQKSANPSGLPVKYPE